MVNSKSGEDYKNLFRLSLQFFGEDSNGGDDDDFDGDFFDDDDTDFYGSDEEDAEDGDTDEGGNTDEDGDTDEGGDPDEGGTDDDAQDANDDAQDADDNTDAEDSDTNDSENSADGADTNAGSENTNAGDANTNADLIAELRALGYVGNDIASLTADMKRKREAKAAEDLKAQKAADKADGKAHVRSGAPGKSASGDGTGGISERQVVAFAERTGCSKEEARRVLTKHARMMA